MLEGLAGLKVGEAALTLGAYPGSSGLSGDMGSWCCCCWSHCFEAGGSWGLSLGQLKFSLEGTWGLGCHSNLQLCSCPQLPLGSTFLLHLISVAQVFSSPKLGQKAVLASLWCWDAEWDSISPGRQPGSGSELETHIVELLAGDSTSVELAWEVSSARRRKDRALGALVWTG